MIIPPVGLRPNKRALLLSAGGEVWGCGESGVDIKLDALGRAP